MSQPAVRDLLLDDLLHGSIDLDDPANLRFRYLRTMDVVVEGASPTPRALTALHIGGGAFALPRHFTAEQPQHRGIGYSRLTPRLSGSTARSSG